MANYKIKDRYFITCEGKQIEVSEEIYRMQAYYHNKERNAMRAFYTYTVLTEEGILKSKPSRLTSIFEEHLAGTLQAQSEDPLTFTVRREQEHMLHLALNALPTRLKHIICLLYFDQHTEQEVAEMLGVCQATVSNLKHKALQLLADYFKGRQLTIADFDLL